MSITDMQKGELACVYAGLLLHDEGSDITAEKISKILEASGNKVDSFYPEFFAKFLSKTDIKSMLTAQPSAPAGPAPEHHEEEKKGGKKEDKKDDKKGKKEDKKKEEKKKEEKKVEEEEEDMGFGDLF